MVDIALTDFSIPEINFLSLTSQQLEIICEQTKVACIYDEDFRIVDLITGERLGQLAESDDADSNEVVTSFCVHPNGNEVVVSTQNFLLRHWNLTEKKCIRVIRGHTMPVLAMAYDATGNIYNQETARRGESDDRSF